MDYERKDSMAKAKNGKEPQKLHYTMSAGDKGNRLQRLEQDRMTRKQRIEKMFNEISK